MNLVRPTSPVVGRIVSNDSCLRGKSASYVNHTVIDVANTPLAGTFRAGQSFGVIPPGIDDRGKAHKVRLYSIACPSWGEDGAGQHISTTPKRLIDEFVAQKAADDPNDHSLFLGVCSNYLCDLNPGDEVLLTGPQGKRFLLPEQTDRHDYLFIATGTGIAPFRGMLLELLTGPAGPSQSRIDLVMGAPYTTDLLYDDLLTDLAARFSNFHYHTAISREASPMYVNDLIDRRMDYFESLIGSERTLLYLCGLEGMDSGVFDVLTRHDLVDGYATERSGKLKPTSRTMLEVY
jgi:ferredoxin--NADP+ reductase